MPSSRPIASDALRAADQFQLLGRPVQATPYGSGHIHDTFLVQCRAPHANIPYILQRINHEVFPRPDHVMDNIQRVTGHLRRKIEAAGGNPDRECLTIVPTHDQQSHCRDDHGWYWRAYLFIIGAATHDVLTDNRQATEAAKAFGHFQALLADLPGKPLHESIANFHHTPSRFQALQHAIDADTAGRAESCRAEIDTTLSEQALTTTVTDGLADGTIPTRVTHNDTKINNVMLDSTTGAGICIIDLDTVMPGSALYDFGDMVRTSVGHFAENETDLSRVDIDLDRFTCLVSGYLASAGDFLVPAEIERLPTAGILITFENAIRFLTDYLQGDTYFKIHHPRENLDRARTQFALVRAMQRRQAAMREIVATHR